MITKFKSKFQPEDNKRLLSNFISLSVLQGANYILPLITLPYLVRVLGVEKFGLLSFSLAMLTFFSIFIEFGFNIFATKEVSIHRNNKDKINEIYSSVMSIKVLFIFISLILLSVIVFSFDKFSQYWYIYYYTFLIVIGQSLFPLWFFQGIEKMKYVTYLNIASKVFFTITLFIFVQDKTDYYLVPLLTAIGSIIVALYSIYLIRTRFNVRFRIQTLLILKHYYEHSKYIFFANISIALYSSSTTFILGLLTNNIVVGYYSAAEKIIQAFKSLIYPLSQAIYPFLSKMKRKDALRFINKISPYIIIFMLFLSLLTLIYTDYVVKFFLGKKYIDSIVIVKILSLIIVLKTINVLYVENRLYVFGFHKEVSKIMYKVSLIHLIIIIPMIFWFSENGAAFTTLLSEGLVAILTVKKFNEVDI